MVDSAVVVWVMDLAGLGIGVKGRSAWLCGFFFLFSSILSPSHRWIVVVDTGSWIMVFESLWRIVDHDFESSSPGIIAFKAY